MIGQTISHYRITEKLGGGGMGVVYKAEDTRLGRNVALKFLPEEMQQDSTARKRFLREAKSAAALDHPYICKIYEVGEEKEQSFISMEYIQGMTLSQKLKEGPLPLKKALETAVEIAEALETAHKGDIVHRDLKPSNIMLTPEGHVKVMDFGLAKRLTPVEGQDEEEITTKLTKDDSILGTVPYMSPEQLRGQEVDARSDIFSFGVVLYEMLTGVHPFKKSGHIDTAKAVLSDTSPPLSRYTEDIPILLQHTVKKMLAKERDERYQLIHEVRTDLGELIVTSGESAVSQEVPTPPPAKRSYLSPAVAGGAMLLVILALVLFWPFTPAPVEGTIDSIAILPFENVSGDPELEYLSDGIADSIISSLSQIASLKVMSSSAVRRYKGAIADPQLVGDELGVRAVLWGRLLQPGDAFSIRVELVDAQDNTQIWGAQYSRQLDEILSFQEEIAQEISQKLRLQISGEEQAQLAKQGTTNPEAYQDYLRGRYHSNNRRPEDVERGIEYFNKAIDEDPDYAQAYAGLADSYFFLALYGARTTSENYQQGLLAAQKALELDDALAEAHTAMGRLKGTFDWDWSASEEHLTRAIELNPNYGDAHLTLGTHLARQGQLNEVIAEVKKAIEVDPLSIAYINQLARLLMFNRQYDEAIERFQEAIEFNPITQGVSHSLIFSYWLNGMYQEAIAESEKSDSLQGNSDSQRTTFFRQLASGNRADAMRALENWKGLGSGQRGEYYAMLGEKDSAIEWLTKAVEERDGYVGWAKVYPSLDPLRDDPRFQDLLLRMNLVP